MNGDFFRSQSDNLIKFSNTIIDDMLFNSSKMFYKNLSNDITLNALWIEYLYFSLYFSKNPNSSVTNIEYRFPGRDNSKMYEYLSEIVDITDRGVQREREGVPLSDDAVVKEKQEYNRRQVEEIETLGEKALESFLKNPEHSPTYNPYGIKKPKTEFNDESTFNVGTTTKKDQDRKQKTRRNNAPVQEQAPVQEEAPVQAQATVQAQGGNKRVTRDNYRNISKHNSTKRKVIGGVEPDTVIPIRNRKKFTVRNKERAAGAKSIFDIYQRKLQDETEGTEKYDGGLVFDVKVGEDFITKNKVNELKDSLINMFVDKKTTEEDKKIEKTKYEEILKNFTYPDVLNEKFVYLYLLLSAYETIYIESIKEVAEFNIKSWWFFTPDIFETMLDVMDVEEIMKKYNNLTSLPVVEPGAISGEPVDESVVPAE